MTPLTTSYAFGVILWELFVDVNSRASDCLMGLPQYQPAVQEALEGRLVTSGNGSSNSSDSNSRSVAIRMVQEVWASPSLQEVVPSCPDYVRRLVEDCTNAGSRGARPPFSAILQRLLSGPKERFSARHLLQQKYNNHDQKRRQRQQQQKGKQHQQHQQHQQGQQAASRKSPPSRRSMAPRQSLDVRAVPLLAEGRRHDRNDYSHDDDDCDDYTFDESNDTHDDDGDDDDDDDHADGLHGVAGDSATRQRSRRPISHKEELDDAFAPIKLAWRSCLRTWYVVFEVCVCVCPCLYVRLSVCLGICQCIVCLSACAFGSARLNAPPPLNNNHDRRPFDPPPSRLRRRCGKYHLSFADEETEESFLLTCVVSATATTTSAASCCGRRLVLPPCHCGSMLFAHHQRT
jgi:hypothetical protein